jgi:hypothetical protein
MTPEAVINPHGKSCSHADRYAGPAVAFPGGQATRGGIPRDEVAC